MPKEIKFGTDGWRGIIADDYTFDNVRRVGGAIAAYVLKHEDARKGLLRRLRHAFRLSGFRARHLRSDRRSGHSRPPLQRQHSHARAFLLREEVGHRRWRRDHLQPQSVQLERREVQGEVSADRRGPAS